VATLAIGFLLGGCASRPSARDDATAPMIAISPRVAERLAQMNRFRRHDRPRARVTVEEVDEDEKTETETETETETDASAESSETAETAAPAP
jgi:hypothetical protein